MVLRLILELREHGNCSRYLELREHGAEVDIGVKRKEISKGSKMHNKHFQDFYFK
jgi:hypothetical protein